MEVKTLTSKLNREALSTRTRTDHSVETKIISKHIQIKTLEYEFENISQSKIEVIENKDDKSELEDHDRRTS